MDAQFKIEPLTGWEAHYGTEDEITETIPVMCLCQWETGEVTYGGHSERQQRFHPDMTDPLFFPEGFLGVVPIEDEDEETDDVEELEDMTNDEPDA